MLTANQKNMPNLDLQMVQENELDGFADAWNQDQRSKRESDRARLTDRSLRYAVAGDPIELLVKRCQE